MRKILVRSYINWSKSYYVDFEPFITKRTGNINILQLSVPVNLSLYRNIYDIPRYISYNIYYLVIITGTNVDTGTY